MDFLKRFFSRNSSKDTAKKRLKLVLIHDRTDISPEILEKLREDIIEMDLDRENGSVALVANIPILKVKRIKQERD